MMASPTGKEFRSIITFLFRKIDPNFEFGGNFEEEVKTYLKLFGYPFSVSKAALTAVGSPHTWPGLLAALVWLCEYLTYYNETSQGKKEGENTGNFDSLLEGDENYHIFYRCTADSYAEFLEGNDNYTSLDEGLANTFEEKNEAINKDIELLGERNAELKKEIELLSNTQATIEELETKKKNLASDNEKFQSLIANLQDHKRANEKLVEERLKEQGEKEKRMESLAKEKAHLQELLHQQKFTPMEVQEMAHQKAMLQETVTNLDLQKQELTREIWDAEITNAKVLGKVESKVNEFNKVALDVGILPATSKYANGIDLEVKLTPLAQDHIDNHGGEGNEAIAKCEDLVNLNLTKVVKPALHSLKLRLGQQIADEQTTLRESGDAYSESTDSKIEQEEKVKALSARITKLDAQLKKEKEGGDEEIKQLVTKVEAEECALNEIRSQQESALMASGKDVAALNNQFMQQQQILKDERDTLLAEIHSMSERVLKHKMTIGGILRDFENGLNSMREDESS